MKFVVKSVSRQLKVGVSSSFLRFVIQTIMINSVFAGFNVSPNSLLQSTICAISKLIFAVVCGTAI